MAEAAYIKKTQDALGAVVKKPPLTDKLLAKPPFRFLHDIIMAVMKNTGFMEGLYSGDELDSAQVSDKDKKIAFLQKAIDIVQMINGDTLSVKPGKIVAGQEADKTNEFLQALAKALKKQPNSSEFVQRVLNGDAANSSAGSNKENKKTRSQSKEKKEEKTKEKEEKPKEESSKSSKDGAKARSASKEGREPSAKASTKRENSSERMSSKKEKSDDQLKKPSKSSSKERKSETTDNEEKKSSSKSSSSSKDKEKKSSSSSKDKDKEEKKSSSSKKSSSEIVEDKKEDDSKKRKSKKKDEENGTDANHLSMNGSDDVIADKAPKKSGKLKIDLSKNAGGGDNEIGDMPTSPEIIAKERRGSVSAKEANRPTLSAIDSRKKDAAYQDEDDDGLVKPGVIRQTRSARPATASSAARPGTAAGRPSSMKQDISTLKRREITVDDKKLARNDSIVNEDHQAVRKVITEANDKNDDDDNFIIDDRDGQITMDALLNDAEGNGPADEEVDEKGDHGQLVRKILETKKGLENQIRSDGKEKSAAVVVYDVKEKEKTRLECQKLQELVQQLTRNSHPLGKIVDFLQEDVDSMLRELQQWRQEYKTNMNTVRQQLGLDSGQLEPLKSKLKEMEQQINEQMDAITAVRGRMLQNEDKIQKLLASVAKK